MAAIQDFLKKNVQSAYGGTAGKGLLAVDAVAIATSDNKFKSILKTARDLALFRIIWPTALLGALSGIQTAFRHIVIDSGSLAAAIERIKAISLYQGQFEPLLKGAALAKQRVAELITFASKSPFSLDSVVQASRSLEIFSRGAMGSGESLKLVENIARASGTSLEAATDAFGGLYRALENKEPISQASQEIQRMGLLSSQTADKIQRLQNTGASFAQVWLTVQAALKVNSKQTDDFSQSIEGLSKQLSEQREQNKAVFAKSFVPAETTGVKLSLGTAQNLQPVMETLGRTLASVTTIGENFSAWVTNLITSIPGLSTAIGVTAKSFVILAEGVGLLAAIKGAQGLFDLAKTLVSVGPSLTKSAVSARLAATSISLLDKSAQAAANGSMALSKIYELLGMGASKASTAVGGLSLSFRGLAVALATNPLTWVMAAIAAVAGIWQLKEATDASTKALNDLSEANAALLHSSTDNIKAIETEDDAYAALAKTTEDAIAAKKKLKELGPTEEAGGLEKTISKLTPFFTGGITSSAPKDIFGIKERREARNSERDVQEQTANLLERKTNVIGAKLASGQLAPNKEKQAVLEEAAARKIRLDQMERENKIQLATGHEKLKLMQEEQRIEAGKGAEGEGTAEARAELEGKTQEILARKELKPRQQLQQIAEVARTSPSAIIREEQRVREMAPGKEKAAAELAITTRRKDVETDRTSHIEREKALQATNAAAVLEQNLADIRLVAEEKIAKLKTVGVERAKEEYAIKVAALEETMKAQEVAGHPQEARATRAQIAGARQEEFERTRGVEVTKEQFQLELEQHAARRGGRTAESQRLEDVGSFLGHFEELRSQFGEPEAQKMAVEKRRDELLEEQRGTGAVVTSSLQRIGGGGGVAGVNGDSIQRVQERIRDLTANSVRILERIDANTKETEKTAPPPAGVVAPPAPTIPAGPTPAMVSTESTPATTAKIVVPGQAPAIPPSISITNPPVKGRPPIEASLAQVKGVQERRSRGIAGAQIVVPGEAPTIPPSISITRPPVAPRQPQPANGLEGRQAQLDAEQNALQARSLTIEPRPGQGRVTAGPIRVPGAVPITNLGGIAQRLQLASQPHPSEDLLPTGPNFYGMKVLRILKDIHESHMQSNDHLDTIAGKEAGVQ